MNLAIFEYLKKKRAITREAARLAVIQGQQQQ